MTLCPRGPSSSSGWWADLPPGLAKFGSGGWAGRGDMALVHRHLRPYVVDVGSRVAECLHTLRGMVLLGGIHQQVISKDPRHSALGSHVQNPWSHEEGNHGHGEGASLWYACSVLMCLADVLPYLVVSDQLFLEGNISLEDGVGHASLLREVVNQGSDHLGEAFVDANAGSSQVRLLGEVVFHLQLGEEPALFGPSARDASEHLWFSPGLDPTLQILDPDRCPEPVDHRGDLQDAIGLGIASIARVFAQKDSTS